MNRFKIILFAITFNLLVNFNFNYDFNQRNNRYFKFNFSNHLSK